MSLISLTGKKKVTNGIWPSVDDRWKIKNNDSIFGVLVEDTQVAATSLLYRLDKTLKSLQVMLSYIE